MPMNDLVRQDALVYVSPLALDNLHSSLDLTFTCQGGRIFTGPDGFQYRWRPSGSTQDVVVSDRKFHATLDPCLRETRLLAPRSSWQRDRVRSPDASYPFPQRRGSR